MHQNKNKNQHTHHIPVLLGEVTDVLAPREGEKYLDLTAGYGGHASAILERTLNPAQATLIDRDESAVEHLRSQFAGTGIQIIHKDFLEAARELQKENRTFDLMLADLGVSSPHLNQASRGFGFSSDGPLDMRMDQSQELRAETIVNNYSEGQLEDILREYGEEPKAARIARILAENRPVMSTSQLASLVARAWPGQSTSHPATRTFQALRIAVNNELGLLKQALPVWIDLLAPGGRLAVITFHSLEDRIVKQYFASVGGDRYDAEVTVLTKKPVLPSRTEIVSNPRARSAKLRAVAKIKT